MNKKIISTSTGQSPPITERPIGKVPGFETQKVRLIQLLNTFFLIKTYDADAFKTAIQAAYSSVEVLSDYLLHCPLDDDSARPCN